MDGGLSWLLIACLAGLLLWACVGDWRSRIIPNRLNAAIALLAIPFWWSIGLDWTGVAWQIAVAFGVFALFALAFRLGMMGGGDVKLVTAVALWLPGAAVAQLLVVMAIAGGVLTLAMLIPHRLAKAAGQPEIPYGIAIAFAAFWVIGEPFLNQFVR
jgi:prepilin peptidase CpaA